MKRRRSREKFYMCICMYKYKYKYEKQNNREKQKKTNRNRQLCLCLCLSYVDCQSFSLTCTAHSLNLCICINMVFKCLFLFKLALLFSVFFLPLFGSMLGDLFFLVSCFSFVPFQHIFSFSFTRVSQSHNFMKIKSIISRIFVLFSS